MADTRTHGIAKLRQAAALLGDTAGDDPMRSALRLVVDGLADVLESTGTTAAHAPTPRAEALQAGGSRTMLSAADVAAELGCSKRQAYTIAQQAGAQPIGRLVRISRGALDGWLAKQAREAGRPERPLIRPVQPRVRPRREDVR